MEIDGHAYQDGFLGSKDIYEYARSQWIRHELASYLPRKLSGTLVVVSQLSQDFQ